MSSASSAYHIPFPTNFLTVNTPVKKSSPAVSVDLVTPTVAEQPAHGFLFLSNQPTTHTRQQSVSSVSSTASDATPVSAPSSPPTKAAESPVLSPKVFTPLQVNARSALPPANIAGMTPVARSAFLSNRY